MKHRVFAFMLLLVILILPAGALSADYPTFVPDATTVGVYYWTGPTEVEEDLASEEESKAIRTLILPSDMQSFNGYYNYQLEALEEYRVDDSSQFLECVDGVVFTKDMTILLTYPRSKTTVHYSVPDSVVGIAGYAFAGNPYLQVISFPKDLAWVGRSAFSECTSLSKIDFNDSLSCIGDKAFEYCGEFSELYFPKELKIIGYRAFYMSGLSKITLNDGLLCIMGEAFFTHQFGATDIYLPDTLIYIDRTMIPSDENIHIIYPNNIFTFK